MTRLSPRGADGRYLDRWRAAEFIAEEAGELESVKRAAYWRWMFRHGLYKSTLYYDRLLTKMNRAQERAKSDVDQLMREYGITSIPIFGREKLSGLRDAPAWGGTFYDSDIQRSRMRRREAYWRRVGNECRAQHWALCHVAIADLRQRWPLSLSALDLARRYVAAEENRAERSEIEGRALMARREEEQAREERRRKRQIVAEAREMVADLLPGVRIRNRIRKAEGFDLLVKLLESADVDAKTKAAVGRLRELVEEEYRTPGGVSGGAGATPAQRRRFGNSGRGRGGIPAAAG